MFQSLPSTFRTYGIPADVRTLLLLRKSIQHGLIKTFGDLYVTLKCLLVKEAQHLGPFTKAYYDYFLNIEIKPGQRLDEAISRSETFKEWQGKLLLTEPNLEEKDFDYFINRFMNEIHLTQHDIKNIISGSDILDKDDPSMKDNGGGASQRKLEEAADYSNVDIQELLDRMEKVRNQQNDIHSGGSHWIGQGGISAYGAGGAALGGIRVGGAGGGRMARKVVDDPRFFPIDLDQTIGDNNVDAALAHLKGVVEFSAIEELDIPITIKDGIKEGGLFLPKMKEVVFEQMQIILLVDNGGYSMDPYIRSVTKLFRKMKTRFAHDLKVYYFHNTLYDHVYSDEQRRNPFSIKHLVKLDPNYCIFVVGDAAMAPYELSPASIKSWTQLKDKFSKMVWLNPEPLFYWQYTITTMYLKQLIPMFPLTTRGIEQAVLEMNKKNKKNI